MTSATSERPPTKPSGSHGVAVLFPGQGSQHTGMGKRIAGESGAAREVYDEADRLLGFNLSELCFDGSDDELRDTVNTQPAILTTSLAYLAYLREKLQERGRKLQPTLIAGHSLGQFSAAVAAGSLDFSDGLRLVLERGRIMGEWARSRPGGLVTILGLNERQVRDVCRDASPEGEVGIAVYNGPGQTVISGEEGPLQKAIAIARERGGRVLRLPISVPGHTPLMQDAARELANFISTLQFRDPNPPIVSNISARMLTTAQGVRDELSNQICAAVQWARCVMAMANQGANPMVELGPGNALTKLARRIRGGAEVINADDATPRLLDLPAAVLARGAAARKRIAAAIGDRD